ncbi:MAG TPA: GlsB/YeaQ/YmgE family stress response membrane protein [Pseudolabrys sp.]|nr:GlsB/YeaQ/YmgE family stress response membrane protein [Pseudolabrys sp.]
MGIISWIVIGLIAGWLAHRILGGRDGILNNLAVGLIGAIVGGVLFTELSVAVAPDFFGSLITAIIGALVFLVVWRAIRRA